MVFHCVCRQLFHRQCSNILMRSSLKTSPMEKNLLKSSEAGKSNRIVWVDLEMTGLDLRCHHIIEMACLITDEKLNVVAEAPNLIIHQPEDVLAQMNQWCTETHGVSGLTKAVQESRISLKEAETTMFNFLKEHVPEGQCPLAGNSVHADKGFLQKYMPSFLNYLHYRIIDVSTVKELCRRWYPDDYHLAPEKAVSHRALEDIKESIKELQFYRKAIFKQDGCR